MRRPPPNFKVERRTPRRPARSSQTHDNAIDPSYDDIPTRDVNSDEDDLLAQAQEAEHRLFGSHASSAQRYRDDAEKLFAKPPEEPTLPIDSVDIFPPMRPKPKPVIETPVEAKEEPKPEPVRRILQSVTWVDPVEQRLREEEERKATRRVRQPREAVPRAPRQSSTRNVSGTRARAAMLVREHAPAPTPQPISVSPENLEQVVRLRPLPISTRTRHPEPRILYNAWNYPRFLRDARGMSKDVATIILKPGEGWKRRLPIAAWK
jgi:hypothetical protein